MKTIILMLIVSLSYGQIHQRTTIGIATEPNAIVKDGFNLSTSITHETGRGYICAELFAFPNLNNIGYYSANVSGGINLTAGYFDEHRFYLGGVLGLSRRLNETYPLAGYEAGYSYYINERFAITLNGSVHYRADSDFYEGDKNVFNGKIGVAFRID